MSIYSWTYEVDVSSIPTIYPWNQRWTCRAELPCSYRLSLLGKTLDLRCTSLIYNTHLLCWLDVRIASRHFVTRKKQLPFKKATANEIGRLTERQTDRQSGRVKSLRKRGHFLNHASLLIRQLQGNWFPWSELPGISFLFLSRTEKLKKANRYSLLILYLNDYF